MVVGVDPNSPAFEHGMREGMVVLRVGKKEIKSVEEFKTALKGETLAKGILLYVQAGNGKRLRAAEGIAFRGYRPASVACTSATQGSHPPPTETRAQVARPGASHPSDAPFSCSARTTGTRGRNGANAVAPHLG